MTTVIEKDENVMVFQPKLAQLLGLNETIIINQIHYWLKKKKNIIDGRPWVYNTYENWQEQICFLSVSTIKKAIKKLESMGIVIAGNFNRSKIDKTKWYTIDYEVIQKLYETENEKIFEDKISQTIDKNNPISDINKQRTDTNELSKGSELLEEEVRCNQAIPETTTKTNSKDNKDTQEDEGLRAVFRRVVEFFSENIRLPSPYELEKIKCLCEEFKDSELILFAVEQSVESNARNLRYVEKVLYSWLDKGIKTRNAAEAYVKNYKKYKGDGENERSRGIYGDNKCHNSKDPSRYSSKWSGYKPPKPKGSADIDVEGLI
ncbi:DnaD domain-containing protein [Clostridium magnum]|uniref:DnaD domain-containing protein n=1 Tax=Clostridium magnum TaxID=33954 RepID=UPI00091EAEC9|nr:DnaD domain protein [Clostridium magnum]SHH76886.1 DnaD and phage-associated domain-containing protein [Clostridium magnum DSM 2767]